MSHFSPKPVGAVRSIAASAMRRITGAVDRIADHESAMDRAMVPGGKYRSGQWLALIGAAPTAAGAPPFCWCYQVTAVDLAVTLTEGVCPSAVATTTAIAGDLAKSGPALNLYELLNTSTSADGIDPTNLPGTYAPLPAKGLVRCWHQRLQSGKVVIMFAKSVTIDGECE